MKALKKAASLVLVLSILLSLVVLPAQATDASLSVNKQTTVSQGEKFSVDLSLAENPGFGALQARVYYNSNILEIGTTAGTDFVTGDSNFTGAMLVGNTEQVEDKDSAHAGDEWKYATVNVIAMGAFSGNGTLITLNFTAKAGLESCNTPLDIQIYAATDADGVDNASSVVLNNGTVTINGVTPEIDTVVLNETSVTVDGTAATPNDVQVTVTSKRGSNMTSNVNYSVTAKDSGDKEIDASGVTVAADGKVTVTPKAKAGIYTITAEGNGTTSEGKDTATLTVTRTAPEAKFIAIYQRTTTKNEAGEDVVTDAKMEATGTILIPPDTATADNVYTYIVKSTDQYDDVTDVTTTAEDWTFETADEFVTFANGVVTVKKGATADKPYTMKAKSGTLESAVVTLTSRSINTVAPTVTINEANLVYGHKWSEIVTLGTDGKADLNGTDVLGKFTIVGADTRPDAGSQTFAVVYNSDDGLYKDIPVTLKAGTTNPVTIAKKHLKIDDSGVVVTKEYDGTTAAGTVTGELKLTDVLDGDDVSLTGTLAASEYPEAGKKNGYTVTLSGYSLTGDDAGNYTVDETYSFPRASITGTKPILNTHFKISVPASKTYDGTASAASVTDKATGLGNETITYAKKNDDDTYGTPTTTAPVNAGTYKVIVSFAEGANFAEMTGDLAFVAADEVEIEQAERNLTINKDSTARVVYLFPNALTSTLKVEYDDLDGSGKAELTYELEDDVSAVSRNGDTFTAIGNGNLIVKVLIPDTENYFHDEDTIDMVVVKDPVKEITASEKDNAESKLVTKLNGTTIQVAGFAKNKDNVSVAMTLADALVASGWSTETEGTSVKILDAGKATFATYTIDLTNVVVNSSGVTVEDKTAAGSAGEVSDILAAVSKTLMDLAQQLGLTGTDKIEVAVNVSTTTDASGKTTVNVGAQYTVTKGGTAQTPVDMKSSDLKAPITVSVTASAGKTYKFARNTANGKIYPIVPNASGDPSWQMEEFGEVELLEDAKTVTINYLDAAGNVTEIRTHDLGSLEMPTATGSGTFEGWILTKADGTPVEGAAKIKELTAKIFDELTGGDELTATPSFYRRSSGGGSSSSYTPSNGTNAVTVKSARNGSVKLSSTRAKAGETVTITATPKKGYEVDEVLVTDRNGDNVRVRSGKEENTFTFTMPETAVTVEATFKAADGETPEPDTNNPFYDVADSAYYYDAVLWAVDKGVTAGTSDSTFSPNNACTRAQTVTFLWRAAGSPAPSSTVNPFTDVVPGSYYYDAVLWAVEQGITTGLTATTFGPNATVNRGQVVTFLYRSAKASPVDAANPFTDVSEGAYYTSAVLWAVSNGITNGTTDTTFAPGNPCTRGQIVTFLYRHFA